MGDFTELAKKSAGSFWQPGGRASSKIGHFQAVRHENQKLFAKALKVEKADERWCRTLRDDWETGLNTSSEAIEGGTGGTKSAVKRVGIQHLPALDGLRGLAVIGVLFFHDDRLTGGYLGVDLFFVLSGYLITSLLIAEWRSTQTLNLKAFWIRRARRLFPALFALLVFVAVYAIVLAKPRELSRIRYDSLATLFYTANWRTIFEGRSYWDLFNAPSPLEHTWSLAIEEQFYVLWPLFVYVIFRVFKNSSRALGVASAVLCLLSVGVMSLLFTLSPEKSARVYMGTDTRGAAILAGAILACAMASRKDALSDRAVRALDVLGGFAVAVLALAWFKLDGQSPLLYRGGFWVTELCVVILIACASQGGRSLTARILSNRLLTLAGLISYGLYLWHWPVFVIITPERMGFEGIGITAIRFGLTLLISILSYRYLEQPIRKNGLRIRGAVWVVLGVFGLETLLLLGATRYGAVLEAKPIVIDIPGLPSLGDRYILPPKGTGRKEPLRVLVVGDSVAQALGERMHWVQQGTGKVVAEQGVGNCSILHDQYLAHSLENRPHLGGDCDAHWEKQVKEQEPNVVLVVLGGGYFAPVKIGDTWRKCCEKEWDEAYEKELTRQIRLMSAAGARVIVTVVPYPVGGWRGKGLNEKIDCFNALLKRAADAVPGTSILDLKTELCPSGQCKMEDKGAPIRPDGMHFQGEGAENIARWVLEQIK